MKTQNGDEIIVTEEKFDDRLEIRTLLNNKVIKEKIKYYNGIIEVYKYNKYGLHIKTKIVPGSYVITEEYDNKGRIVLTTRDDGFKEKIEYQDDNSNFASRIETWYPGGQYELEQFAPKN